MFNQRPLPYFAANLQLRNNDYFISFLCLDNNVLKVEVRDLETIEEWHGTYSADYIEELTKKTGNFKTFDVFLAMLFSAISNKCVTLVLDLVGYKELESLRLAKKPTESSLNSKEQFEFSQRRYLILTYITDFDRTFYPLPLSYCGIQDSKKLILLINKLRQSLYNSGGSHESRRSVDENSSVINNDFERKLFKLEKERDMALAKVNQFKSILKALYTEDQMDKQNGMIKKLLGSPKPVDKCLSHEICRLKNYVSPYGQPAVPKHAPLKKRSLETSPNPCRSQDRDYPEAALFLHSSNRGLHNRSFSSQRACSGDDGWYPRIQRSNSIDSQRLWRRNQCTSPGSATEDGDTLSAPLLSSVTHKRTHSADSIRKNGFNRQKFDPVAYVLGKQMQRRNCDYQRKKTSLGMACRSPSPGPASSSSALLGTVTSICDDRLRRRTPLNSLENYFRSPSHRNNYLQEEVAVARHSNNRGHRSPHSRQLLNRAGVLLSDSESECLSYSSPKQVSQRRRPCRRDSAISSESEIKYSPARRPKQQNNAHKTIHPQPRKPRNSSVEKRQGPVTRRNSSTWNSDMHEELNEMDLRLDALQGFLTNYFKKPITT